MSVENPQNIELAKRDSLALTTFLSEDVTTKNELSNSLNIYFDEFLKQQSPEDAILIYAYTITSTFHLIAINIPVGEEDVCKPLSYGLFMIGYELNCSDLIGEVLPEVINKLLEIKLPNLDVYNSHVARMIFYNTIQASMLAGKDAKQILSKINDKDLSPFEDYLKNL